MYESLRYILPAAAGFLAFFGVLLTVIGASIPSRSDQIIQRVKAATEIQQKGLIDIEMQMPFMDRFVKPLLKQLSNAISHLTPSGALEGMQRQIRYAGLSNRMQVSDFIGLRGIALLIGSGLAIAIGVLTNQGLVALIILVLILGGVAYLFPTLWLRQQISRRRAQILRALPDAIDLLTISVEAGLGFDQALARVVSKSENALTREFARVIAEMRVGVTRRDALRALVERTGVDDLSTFISAIIQAEQLGASIANVLRIQSAEMRVRRRQHVQRQAQTAPIKMLFPMAFLIFPPIFIVVLGPAIPGIVKTFAPHVQL